MNDLEDKEAAMILYKIITNPDMHIPISECERIFKVQLWLKEILTKEGVNPDA